MYGTWIYGLLFAIIFCETGFIIMAMLPGDSLLFVVGALAARGMLNIYYVAILLVSAAFFGNLLNYWTGKKIGNWLIHHPNSHLINHSHIKRTSLFYAKNGGKTMIIGCFIPIIRTCAAFVAGVAQMQHSKFIIYNAVGVCTWICSLLAISYWFGNIPIVKQHFTFIVVAIIFISLLPAVINYFYSKAKKS